MYINTHYRHIYTCVHTCVCIHNNASFSRQLSNLGVSAEISSHPTHHFAMQTSEDKSKLESTCPTGQAENSQEYALHYGGY